MIYGVPQYIDVEDKIAGPLTAKQLGWLVLLGIILLILWNSVEFGVFILIAIPVGLLFLALAFYRPNGMPLISFFTSGITYVFNPKVFVWKRSAKSSFPKKDVQTEQKKILAPDRRAKEREETLRNLRGFAQMLDSEGTAPDPAVIELLRQRELAKHPPKNKDNPPR